MTASLTWFFASTPIPWTTILCVVLYRHDLSQILHPFKDRYSISEWKMTFQNLEIPFNVLSGSEKASRGNRILTTIRQMRKKVVEQYPNLEFYVASTIVVLISSLLSSVVIVPLLAGSFATRFTWILSVGLQIVSAFTSVFAMRRYFGPFPSPHYKFHLKKNRLGSLARYREAI